jgi:hypothetical protein
MAHPDGNLTVVKQTLAELPEHMAAWAETVLLEQAHTMVGYAQVYCRVDTGSLRDSIRVERGGIEKHWREVRVRAGGYITNPKTGKLVDYARIVEHRYPYMRPAWWDVQPAIHTLLQQFHLHQTGVSVTSP